jgi:multisubunit Na+/H+ antiporter MnhC subunit
VKWLALIVQAICTMVAIAMVHSDNRRATGIALGLFSTGVAVSILLIAAHNRPFTGALSVQPDILLQVLPAQGTSP